jgi:lipopolysaccharide export system permease protein
LTDAFLIVSLLLPRYAFQLFPIAALIGSLLGLGRLAAHFELVAMRAAGVSIAHVLGAVLRAGLVLAVAAMLLGEVIAPASEEEAQQLRAATLSERIALKTRYGFWVRDGNAFINVREIMPGGRLQHLYIYELDAAKKLKTSTYARLAVHRDNAWQLQDIAQSELTENGVQTRFLKTASWASLLDPSMLSLLIVDPHILPMWGLFQNIRFMEQNGLSAVSYEVAFWGKAVTPLVILAMVFLSVPLLFNVRHGVGLGQRIFIGVLIGIGFYILNKTMAQLPMVYDLSPLLISLVPVLVCVASGALLMRWVR